MAKGFHDNQLQPVEYADSTSKLTCAKSGLSAAEAMASSPAAPSANEVSRATIAVEPEA